MKVEGETASDGVREGLYTRMAVSIRASLEREFVGAEGG